MLKLSEEDYEYVKPPDLAASVLSADTSSGDLERAIYCGWGGG